MKILFVAAECTPVVKVGGLADVVGALPKALRADGHDVRIIIPKYDVVQIERLTSSGRVSNLEVSWREKKLLAHVEETRLPNSGVPLYFLDCPTMFHSGQTLHRLQTVYANSGDSEMLRQELERFLFFSSAIVQILPNLGWQPDVVHVHDWHTAFVPVIARVQKGGGRKFPVVVLTIHNLQNQGRWNPADVLAWMKWGGHELPSLNRRDHLGNMNMLQQGVLNADIVNTVSPNYAREILTPEYGEGLERDLGRVVGGVHGILNGIDVDVFNPQTDPALPTRYTAATAAIGKMDARQVLADRLNIKFDRNDILMVSVGRFTEQKGYQLLPPIIRPLVTGHRRMILLGTGTPDIEKALDDLAQAVNGLEAIIAFDARLAQLLYAAGDVFLMPSQFEPCGLGQMIAMRYGTLPVVRDTGGLHDTVRDLTSHPTDGTGFVFKDFSPVAFRRSVERSLEFVTDPQALAAARKRIMTADFSWEKSAREYHKLYARIIS